MVLVGPLPHPELRLQVSALAPISELHPCCAWRLYVPRHQKEPQRPTPQPPTKLLRVRGGIILVDGKDHGKFQVPYVPCLWVRKVRWMEWVMGSRSGRCVCVELN